MFEFDVEDAGSFYCDDVTPHVIFGLDLDVDYCDGGYDDIAHVYDDF